MKYVATTKETPSPGNNATFADLGYLFAKLGATIVTFSGNPLGKHFLAGSKNFTETQHVTLTRDVPPSVDVSLFELLPRLKEFPEHWVTHAEEYREAYLLLSHKPDVVYTWFNEGSFSPLMELSEIKKVRVVNLAEKTSLYQAQDYAMNNSLGF